MSKEKKQKYIDDGHTIFSMDVDAKWNTQREYNRKSNDKKINNQKNTTESIYVSKEERRTLIKAAFKAYIPKLLLVLFSFGLAIILIYFWLK